MPARTAAQVIQRFKDEPPALYHRGGKIEDITTEPGICGGVKSLAALYDHQWENQDTALYKSPVSGDLVNKTFMIPKTREQLTEIGDAMHQRGEFTQGMMGRMPDYLNRAMAGYAGSAEFLAVQNPQFVDNMRNYHTYLQENYLDFHLVFAKILKRPCHFERRF